MPLSSVRKTVCLREDQVTFLNTHAPGPSEFSRMVRDAIDYFIAKERKRLNRQAQDINSVQHSSVEEIDDDVLT